MTHFHVSRLVACIGLLSGFAPMVLGQEASPLDKLDAKSIPAEERFDWQPRELVAVLGTHKGRHWSAIRGLAYSADGKKLASIGNDNMLRLCDAASLRELASLPVPPTARYSHVSFAPDGKTLYASGAAWDISGAEPKADTSGLVGPAFFSTDGKRMLAVEKGGVTLFERDGDRYKELDIVPVGKLTDAYYEPIGLSGDARFIVIRKVEKNGYPGPIQLWEYNAEKKEIERREDFGKKLPVYDREMSVAALSPDGRWLIVGDMSGRSSAVQLWDLSKPKVTQSYLGDSPPSRVSTRYSGSSRRTTGVGFAQDGKVLLVFHSHGYGLHGVASYYTLNAGGTGFTYRGRLRIPFDQYCVASSPDGKVIATAGSDHAIHLWRWPSVGMMDHAILPFAAEHVAFLDEGKTLLASNKTNPALWDMTGKTPVESRVLPGVHKALASSGDGRWVAAQAFVQSKVTFQRKYTLMLVDLEAKEPTGVEVAESDLGIQCAAFTPDGKTIAFAKTRSFNPTGKDDRHGVYLATVGAKPEIKEVLGGPTEMIWSVAVSGDGKLVAAGSGKPVGAQGRITSLEGQVHVWDIGGAKVGPPVVVSEEGAKTVAFAPKERLLVAGGLAGFELWDLRKEKSVRLAQVPEPTHNAAFSPDGQWLMTGSESHADDGSTVQIWSVAELMKDQPDPEPFATFSDGHGTSALAFSADGKKLAMALRAPPNYSNFAIRLCDFPSDGGVRPLASGGITFEAGDLAWTPDGKTLISGGNDQKLRLWDMTQSPPVAKVMPYFDEPVRCVAVSADGKHLAAAGSHGAAVWTKDDKGWGNKRWLPYDGSVYGIALQPDGRSLLVGGIFHSPPAKKGLKSNERETHFNLWDLSGPLPKRSGANGSPKFLAASTDGAFVAYGDAIFGNVTLSVLDGGHLKTKKEVSEKKGLGPRDPVAVSPNGKYLISHDHGGHGASLWRIDPDIARVASVTTKLETGRYRHSVGAFSPDSKLAALLSYEDRVILYDSETGKELKSWTLPNSMQNPGASSSSHLLHRALAFAPDGRHLAISNANGTIYVLRVR